ncbi:MAG: hypothetical protein M1819_006038 [Sarea resinae]|nr:MAG: hypothetical protein M1819_006038 [Sarea resinae]
MKGKTSAKPKLTFHPIYTGNVPVFSPTSSPELDALLTSFRTKIFVPAHLLKRHRDLIYKPTKSKMLSAAPEPITVDIGTEKVTLEPVDRYKDGPYHPSDIARVLSLLSKTSSPASASVSTPDSTTPASSSSSSSDWSNLIPFLQGLHASSRTLNAAQLEKTARLANTSGQQGILTEAIRRVESTGFTLTALPVVREVILGAHLRAAQANWDEAGIAKAFRQAETTIEALEDARHCGGRGISAADPRAQPDIIGVVVELAAAHALKSHGGADFDAGLVATYVTRLRATWHHASFPALDPTSLRASRTALNEANHALMRWAPVAHGLRLAARVLEPRSELGVWLVQATKEVDAVVKATAEALRSANKGSRPRGLSVLEGVESAAV